MKFVGTEFYEVHSRSCKIDFGVSRPPTFGGLMAGENEVLYVVVLGSAEDWTAGRGSLHYIEDKKGERAMPVFTTAEKAEKYVQQNLNDAQGHVQMLESLPVSHIPALTEGRFSVSRMDAYEVDTVAAESNMDYLIRDPRPGAEQETLRVPK